MAPFLRLYASIVSVYGHPWLHFDFDTDPDSAFDFNAAPDQASFSICCGFRSAFPKLMQIQIRNTASYQCCGSGIRSLFDPWIWYQGWAKKINIRIRNEHPGPYFDANLRPWVYRPSTAPFLRPYALIVSVYGHLWLHFDFDTYPDSAFDFDADSGSGQLFNLLRNQIRKLMRILIHNTASYQCCGSGIRCLFDPWIRDPRLGKNQDPDPG
jgi:hypothetical protein